MKKINELEVDDFLHDCVNVDPLFVKEEFTRVAYDLAYWNERYAVAYRAWLKAKINERRTLAFADARIRARFTDEGVKPTEPMVAAEVSVDDAVYAAQLASMEAEVEKVRLHGVVDAVRSKKDALVSIGAHVRAEMAGDPAIRALHAGHTLAEHERRG